MKWMIVVFVAVLGLWGCAKFQQWQANQARHHFLKGLKYYKDPKTGFCFAVREGWGFTRVPCKRALEMKYE